MCNGITPILKKIECDSSLWIILYRVCPVFVPSSELGPSALNSSSIPASSDTVKSEGPADKALFTKVHEKKSEKTLCKFTLVLPGEISDEIFKQGKYNCW